MSGPATYSFGADAVRYGSDLSGQNSAYFLQQSSGTAVVPSDLLVKGDLQVDGTSTLKGDVGVGTSSQTANLTNYGTTTASNFQGTNPADGYRSNFAQGLGANNVTISGPGGSTLLLGDATTPGGNVIGYNGSSATVPVNFGNGLNGTNINLTGGISTASNSTFLANILVSGGIYGGNSSTAPAFPLGALMGAAISAYPITSGGDPTYPYYFISIGKLRIAWGLSRGFGGCRFPYGGGGLPFNFATSVFAYGSLNAGTGQAKRYITNLAGTEPNGFTTALLDFQTNSPPSEDLGFNCIMVGAVA